MLDLLGLLGGGLLRLAPEVIKLFTAKRDADHEYRMTQLQLQIDQSRAKDNLDMVAAQSSAAQGLAEIQALMQAVRDQAAPTGIAWVDAVSSVIRPFLTLWWVVVLYTSAKIISIIVAFQAGATLAQFVPILVTDFDEAVIGSMLSFWFLDRTLRKRR